MIFIQTKIQFKDMQFINTLQIAIAQTSIESNA
jgi:hypothetical protein